MALAGAASAGCLGTATAMDCMPVANSSNQPPSEVAARMDKGNAVMSHPHVTTTLFRGDSPGNSLATAHGGKKRGRPPCETPEPARRKSFNAPRPTNPYGLLAPPSAESLASSSPGRSKTRPRSFGSTGDALPPFPPLVSPLAPGKGCTSTHGLHQLYKDVPNRRPLSSFFATFARPGLDAVACASNVSPTQNPGGLDGAQGGDDPGKRAHSLKSDPALISTRSHAEGSDAMVQPGVHAADAPAMAGQTTQVAQPEDEDCAGAAMASPGRETSNLVPTLALELDNSSTQEVIMAVDDTTTAATVSKQPLHDRSTAQVAAATTTLGGDGCVAPASVALPARPPSAAEKWLALRTLHMNPDVSAEFTFLEKVTGGALGPDGTGDGPGTDFAGGQHHATTAPVSTAGVSPAIATAAVSASKGKVASSNAGSITVGVEELRARLIAAGAQAAFCPEPWVRNHYRWIVWKLASYERQATLAHRNAGKPGALARSDAGKSGGHVPSFVPPPVGQLIPPGSQYDYRWLTPARVLDQLKYRYEREVNRGSRPALRKVTEKDAPAGAAMVLAVAEIVQYAHEGGTTDDAIGGRGEWAASSSKHGGNNMALVARQGPLASRDGGGGQCEVEDGDDDDKDKEARKDGGRGDGTAGAPAEAAAGSRAAPTPTMAAKPQPAVITLTDGWYCLNAVLDEPLGRYLRQGKIFVGQKLLVAGAELLGGSQGLPPLEAFRSVSLSLHANGVRRARWDAKLGFCRRNHVLVALNAVKPKGGAVPATVVTVSRIYPLLYKETLPSGERITRGEKAEDAAQRRHQAVRDRVLEQVQAELMFSGGWGQDEGAMGGPRGGNRGRAGGYMRPEQRERERGFQLCRGVMADPSGAPEGMSAEEHALVARFMPLYQRQVEEAHGTALEEAMRAAGVALEREVVRVLTLRVSAVTGARQVRPVAMAQAAGPGHGAHPPGADTERGIATPMQGEGHGFGEEAEEDDVGQVAAREALVTVWHPPDDLLGVLREGHVFQVTGLKATGGAGPCPLAVTCGGLRDDDGGDTGISNAPPPLAMVALKSSRWTHVVDPARSGLVSHFVPRALLRVCDLRGLRSGVEFDAVLHVARVCTPMDVGGRMEQWIFVVDDSCDGGGMPDDSDGAASPRPLVDRAGAVRPGNSSSAAGMATGHDNAGLTGSAVSAVAAVAARSDIVSDDRHVAGMGGAMVALEDFDEDVPAWPLDGVAHAALVREERFNGVDLLAVRVSASHDAFVAVESSAQGCVGAFLNLVLRDYDARMRLWRADMTETSTFSTTVPATTASRRLQPSAAGGGRRQSCPGVPGGTRLRSPSALPPASASRNVAKSPAPKSPLPPSSALKATRTLQAVLASPAPALLAPATPVEDFRAMQAEAMLSLQQWVAANAEEVAGLCRRVDAVLRGEVPPSPPRPMARDRSPLPPSDAAKWGMGVADASVLARPSSAIVLANKAKRGPVRRSHDQRAVPAPNQQPGPQHPPRSPPACPQGRLPFDAHPTRALGMPASSMLPMPSAAPTLAPQPLVSALGETLVSARFDIVKTSSSKHVQLQADGLQLDGEVLLLAPAAPFLGAVWSVRTGQGGEGGAAKANVAAPMDVDGASGDGAGGNNYACTPRFAALGAGAWLLAMGKADQGDQGVLCQTGEQGAEMAAKDGAGANEGGAFPAGDMAAAFNPAAGHDDDGGVSEPMAKKAKHCDISAWGGVDDAGRKHGGTEGMASSQGGFFFQTAAGEKLEISDQAWRQAEAVMGHTTTDKGGDGKRGVGGEDDIFFLQTAAGAPVASSDQAWQETEFILKGLEAERGGNADRGAVIQPAPTSPSPSALSGFHLEMTLALPTPAAADAPTAVVERDESVPVGHNMGIHHTGVRAGSLPSAGTHRGQVIPEGGTDAADRNGAAVPSAVCTDALLLLVEALDGGRHAVSLSHALSLQLLRGLLMPDGAPGCDAGHVPAGDTMRSAAPALALTAAGDMSTSATALRAGSGEGVEAGPSQQNTCTPLSLLARVHHALEQLLPPTMSLTRLDAPAGAAGCMQVGGPCTAAEEGASIIGKPPSAAMQPEHGTVADLAHAPGALALAVSGIGGGRAPLENLHLMAAPQEKPGTGASAASSAQQTRGWQRILGHVPGEGTVEALLWLLLRGCLAPKGYWQSEREGKEGVRADDRDMVWGGGLCKEDRALVVAGDTSNVVASGERGMGLSGLPTSGPCLVVAAPSFASHATILCDHVREAGPEGAESTAAGLAVRPTIAHDEKLPVASQPTRGYDGSAWAWLMNADTGIAGTPVGAEMGMMTVGAGEVAEAADLGMAMAARAVGNGGDGAHLRGRGLGMDSTTESDLPARVPAPAWAAIACLLQEAILSKVVRLVVAAPQGSSQDCANLPIGREDHHQGTKYSGAPGHETGIKGAKVPATPCKTMWPVGPVLTAVAVQVVSPADRLREIIGALQMCGTC
eukprot:jgi/Mesvir1/23588/Mv18278-RA.2